MLHIIILGKNYFPTKLNTIKSSDKVIILASPDGAIPVSAYKDETLKNMEVKLLPEIKDVTTQNGKEALRIAQAMLIGQLTADTKDYQIYTEDNALLKALAPFMGTNKSTVKKTAASKPVKAEIKPAEDKKEEKLPEPKKEKKASKVTKAEVKTKPAKLPTQAEVRRVLGATNSGYSKAIMEVIKKSNQITFEMDLRMKLVEAGMEASQCKDLAKTLNDEFGKMLPLSMK
jgi:hypothetical protein